MILASTPAWHCKYSYDKNKRVQFRTLSVAGTHRRFLGFASVNAPLLHHFNFCLHLNTVLWTLFLHLTNLATCLFSKNSLPVFKISDTCFTRTFNASDRLFNQLASLIRNQCCFIRSKVVVIRRRTLRTEQKYLILMCEVSLQKKKKLVRLTLYNLFFLA